MPNEQQRDDSGQAVGDGPRPQHAVDAPDQREDEHQRQQQKGTAEQGHEHADATLADGREELGAQQLQSHDEDAEQIDAEVAHGKFEVQLVPAAEDRDDLPRKELEAQKRAIEKQKADLEKLRENADEVEVKSSVSGTIASINASAGKSIGGEEQPLATINVTDRGFTVKIDVTNDQAKKVKTGDTAELVNFWGGDAVATLDQITSSQTAGNRTLVFTLTGDIQAGQNVTLSIGQKSANYDALIPLSGLREDSNGKFVYVLESKSSPLGSRYIATRVTVQELARDDKSAAVSGISSGDFIITTSNKPVEAGKQVRLADNG